MLKTSGHWFRDAHHRRVLLRGVNLGGSSKLPTTPDGRTHLPDDFSNHRTVSFVGRPFPLEDADWHLRRLRHWGFNCLRLLTTWEAIEHAAPGQYDEGYLDYFQAVVRQAGAAGFYIFIDPHQDVWSRMTGGDGAPGWTLELAGLNIPALDASDAALTMQQRGPQYGQMIWPNNWTRLASATMFTLFFGGATVAPRHAELQTTLQGHFIGAISQIAARVRDVDHVLGYDSLNEPSRGYLGLPDLNTPAPVYNSAPQVTPFQTLLLGAGIPQDVPFVERHGLIQTATGMVRLNPDGVSAWRTPRDDIWRQAGIWELNAVGEGVLLQPDYFADFDFYTDGLRPFMQKYAAALRQIHPNCHLFIEGEPGGDHRLEWPNAQNENIVNASHWYDVLTLTTKHYDPTQTLVWGQPGGVSGVEAVQESFVAQLGAIKADTQRDLGDVPTLIGEFGVPFDLDNKASYRTEQFDDASAALASYYDALDANLLHSTLWNYTADNTNEWGDGWNGEDLSIFSLSQQWNPYDLDSGGRGIAGFCRPTVRAAAGTPLSQKFNVRTGEYDLVLEVEANDNPTEVFVPRYQYQEGYWAEVSSGTVEHDLRGQRVLWIGAATGEQWLRIRRPEGE